MPSTQSMRLDTGGRCWGSTRSRLPRPAPASSCPQNPLYTRWALSWPGGGQRVMINATGCPAPVLDRNRMHTHTFPSRLGVRSRHSHTSIARWALSNYNIASHFRSPAHLWFSFGPRFPLSVLVIHTDLIELYIIAVGRVAAVIIISCQDCQDSTGFSATSLSGAIASLSPSGASHQLVSQREK